MKWSKIHESRGTGANGCPQPSRAALHPKQDGRSPPGGAPRSPPQPQRRLQPAPLPLERVTDFTRLSNGITEISSQLSPDAPAVKTKPKLQEADSSFSVSQALLKAGWHKAPGRAAAASSCSCSIRSSRTRGSRVSGAALPNNTGGDAARSRAGLFFGDKHTDTEDPSASRPAARRQPVGKPNAEPGFTQVHKTQPSTSRGARGGGRGRVPSGRAPRRARGKGKLLHKERESGLCYPILHNAQRKKMKQRRSSKELKNITKS